MAMETSGTSPYQAIVERNVFGLKAPPPPPNPEDTKPPPPKILLQGITTILGNKRALFKMQVPPKPGEQPQSFILAEGQRDGDIEVVEIDDKAGKVKLKYFSTIVDLDFENNGVKTASAPAPGGVPKPGGFVPTVPPNPFAPAAGAGAVPTPRPLRMPTTGAAMTPASSGGTPVAASYSGTPVPAYTAVPAAPAYGVTPAPVTSGSSAGTLALSGLTAAPTTPRLQKNWPPETPMTPEEAAIMEAAYTMKNKDAIEKGLRPSIPGSNPLLDSEPTPAQTTTPANPVSTPPLPPGAARAPILPQ